jgi:hypothetical protein
LRASSPGKATVTRTDELFSMKPFDSLTEGETRQLSGRRVMDHCDHKAGSLQGVWVDPSTHRVEFIGLRMDLLPMGVHVVPSRLVELDEASAQIRLLCSSALVKEAPSFNPESELAEVAKQEINHHYGHFVPLRRVSDLGEIHPEETLEASGYNQPPHPEPKSEPDRAEIERQEQAFFNQKGFATDAMGEVDASAELERNRREGKAREDEHRRRHGGADPSGTGVVK